MNAVILVMGLIIVALGVLLKRSVERMNADYDTIIALVDHAQKMEEIICDKNNEIRKLKSELNQA